MKTATIIPLVFPEMLTNEAVNIIKNCDMLYMQTEKHPFCEYCLKLRTESGKKHISMDDLYEQSDDFDELNEKIAGRLAQSPYENIGYAILGNGVNSELIKTLRGHLKKENSTVRVLPSAGFGETALSKAVELGFVDGCCDYDIRSARSLGQIDTSVPLVIEEIDNILCAGEIKLKLSEYYPDGHNVILFPLAKETSENPANAISLPLFELDRQENAEYFDAASVLIVPACPFSKKERYGLNDLMDVMHRLRAPGGCPWDAEQTHKSLRSSLIEETYEVLDAIDREDLTALEEELGDLLLQVVFHAVIEEERGEFAIRDVITGLVDKLVYRHPHVFGSVEVENADEVKTNWETLKQKEKHQNTVADAMNSVPASFPALIRSAKIQKKAAHIGFDWDTPFQALEKVYEEAGEVDEALKNGNIAEITDETGDLLFACVNVARLSKVDAELALKQATDKFMGRFIKMEKLILSENKVLSDMDLDEMDIYWERVKKDE